ncbi:MAG: hypothetical protein ACRDPE_01655 [Solirubrobacterales bacterium]
MPALEIADGLFALSMPVRLDGRVSSHPVTSRGFTCDNVYLALEDGHALLIDTGYTVNEGALFEMLVALLPPSSSLSIWPLRLGEYASICNIRTLAERLHIDTLIGGQDEPTSWVDFRPEVAPYGSPPAAGALATLETRAVRIGEAVVLGSRGRAFHTFEAPLRLLPASWVYDDQTRTLFTSDAFTWVWRATEQGPWSVSSENDSTTPEGVSEYLRGSRFWWLPGAQTGRIREAIATIFAEHEVEAIAPAVGCVIKGREVVAHHAQLLDGVLEEMEHEPAIGRDVGRWNIGGRSATDRVAAQPAPAGDRRRDLLAG